MLTAPDDDEPAPAPPPPTRSSSHRRQSSLAGLKPFLLAGLLVVIGLLIGLNFLLDGTGEVSTNPAPTPGSITIGPPPGGQPQDRTTAPVPPAEPSAPPAGAPAGSIDKGQAPTAPSEFTFYETLKKPSHDPAGTVGLTPPKPAAKQAPSKSAEAPAAESKPSPAKNHVIETTTARNGKFHYTIQVAAFRQQSVADGLIAKLNKKGHDAYLVTASSPNGDGTTYRVRVGRFATHEEADRTAKQLAATEKLHPFITTIGPEAEKKG